MELTHASFFSGVGGLDLGLDRAGWRTVSFSEIDPYASAVLAERWPGIPNLGDIVAVAGGEPTGAGSEGAWSAGRSSRRGADSEWSRATLWSGGFPCQDLSVAGKRAGFAGARSSLAFAFLDLVRAHRPPAILLENVPGLLSSHAGRDFGSLLATLGELRYGWAYRILDARHFGVPQRRRRVFIVALDLERGLGADRAAAVLSVGSRCERHLAAGVEAGAGAAGRLVPGVDIARAITGTSGKRHDDDTDTLLAFDFLNSGAAFGAGESGSIPSRAGWSVLRPPPDPGGVRAPDGLAGRLDDLAPTLRVGPARPQDGGPGDTVPIISFVKRAGAQTSEDSESWGEGDVMSTLNAFDVGDTRTTAAILGGQPTDDPLLPLGLDSHRYRCAGNGVVSSVAEWVGVRLAEELA